MNARRLNYSEGVRFAVGDDGHGDPFHCLRCSSIAVGIWNIVLYCLLHFALFGWQIQVVKRWQWHWENRELPATGAIDQYQARFPGLYAIYTETPERRRVNAMYAIVLICLGLTIVHLVLSAAMLYGCVKRYSQWIFPWFFTSLPLIIFSTAYSVLWWTGDVFNEQLTFSVADFAMSLAVNGVGLLVVLLYYLRLRGKLTSERTINGELSPNSVHRRKASKQRGAAQQCQQNWKLPRWEEPFPEKVPPNIARKLRRKERRERQLRAKVEKKSAGKVVRQRTRTENALGAVRSNECRRIASGHYGTQKQQLFVGNGISASRPYNKC